MKREQIIRALSERAKKTRRRERMQNGKLPKATPVLLSILQDPACASEKNPNGIVTLSGLNPMDAVQIMSESIRLLAMFQKESGHTKPIISRTGLTMPDGSPAPITTSESEDTKGI